MSTDLANKLAVFEENKLLILKQLYRCQNQLCGCDLINILGLPKNLISYHIKLLISLGYVEAVRCGRKKNYKIVSTQRPKVKKILEIVGLI